MNPERAEDSYRPSVLKRIVTADRHSVISRTELAHEFTRLAEHGNKDLLLKIFDAYCAWKTRSSGETQSAEVVRSFAITTLDYVARLADARKITRSYVTAGTWASLQLPTGGKIQKFFRDTVNYHPK